MDFTDISQILNQELMLLLLIFPFIHGSWWLVKLSRILLGTLILSSRKLSLIISKSSIVIIHLDNSNTPEFGSYEGLNRLYMPRLLKLEREGIVQKIGEDEYKMKPSNNAFEYLYQRIPQHIKTGLRESSNNLSLVET